MLKALPLQLLRLVLLAGAVLALPRASAAGKSPKVTFADLAAFKVDIANDRSVTLCQELKTLSGTWVEITGYMLPVKLEGGKATQFFIMRNQMACCFGVPPSASEFVLAEAGGAGLPVAMDLPVTFRGRLKVEPVVEDGNIVQLYEIEDSSVSGS